MTEKLQVHLILEILGKPKENVRDALRLLVEKLGTEKGVRLIEQTLHEPMPVKDAKDLFTSFAEITLELDSLTHYFGIMFGYMPSNIELIKPENIKLTNEELNYFGNRLMMRLHDYDAVVKKTIYERNILENKLREVAPHLFQQPQQQAAPSTQPEKKKLAKKPKTKTSSKKKKK